MDRFIVADSGITYDIITDLKSNMDRFIAQTNVPDNYGATVFKIQYG